MTKAKAKAKDTTDNEAPRNGSAMQDLIDARAQARKDSKITKPARTGPTVTVGLKSPSDMVLRLQMQVTVNQPVMGGGFKEVKEWHPDPDMETITIRGTATPYGQAPRGLIIGGYAMTPGIPQDFMELWLEQNKRNDIVLNGMIIVRKNTEEAKDEAKEMRGLRSGLEPLQESNDPRTPKKAVKGKLVDEISTGDEQPNHAAA